MNERIKELYNKVFAESMNMRWNIEDAEQFAELIMTECVVALAPEVKSEDDAVTINNMVQKVKQHFGVEE